MCRDVEKWGWVSIVAEEPPSLADFLSHSHDCPFSSGLGCAAVQRRILAVGAVFRNPSTRLTSNANRKMGAGEVPKKRSGEREQRSGAEENHPELRSDRERARLTRVAAARAEEATCSRFVTTRRRRRIDFSFVEHGRSRGCRLA